MLFAIYALDKEDSIQLRMDTREAHLAYLATVSYTHLTLPTKA